MLMKDAWTDYYNWYVIHNILLLRIVENKYLDFSSASAKNWTIMFCMEIEMVQYPQKLHS